jgi:hypothetical protein
MGMSFFKLQAGQVHRSMLEQASCVFRDMFEVSTREDSSQTPLGRRPIFHLAVDEPAHVEHFLKAVYNRQ